MKSMQVHLEGKKSYIIALEPYSYLDKFREEKRKYKHKLLCNNPDKCVN